MAYEYFNTCCYKALKHGETECPVCGRIFFKQHKTTTIESDGLSDLVQKRNAEIQNVLCKQY